MGTPVHADGTSYLPDPAHRWRPLMCRAIRNGSQCTELEVVAADGVRILYGRVRKKMLDAGAPCFVRFVSKGTYEISTLGTKEGVFAEIRFAAFIRPDGLTEAVRPNGASLPQLLRPVTVPEQTATPHVHYWHDPVSVSSVPVTYLSGRRKAGPGKKPSPAPLTGCTYAPETAITEADEKKQRDFRVGANMFPGSGRDIARQIEANLPARRFMPLKHVDWSDFE